MCKQEYKAQKLLETKSNSMAQSSSCKMLSMISMYWHSQQEILRPLHVYSNTVYSLVFTGFAEQIPIRAQVINTTATVYKENVKCAKGLAMNNISKRYIPVVEWPTFKHKKNNFWRALKQKAHGTLFSATPQQNNLPQEHDMYHEAGYTFVQLEMQMTKNWIYGNHQ